MRKKNDQRPWKDGLYGVSVRLDEEEFLILKALAESESRTLAQTVRHLIRCAAVKPERPAPALQEKAGAEKPIIRRSLGVATARRFLQDPSR